MHDCRVSPIARVLSVSHSKRRSLAAVHRAPHRASSDFLMKQDAMPASTSNTPNTQTMAAPDGKSS